MLSDRTTTTNCCDFYKKKKIVSLVFFYIILMSSFLIFLFAIDGNCGMATIFLTLAGNVGKENINMIIFILAKCTFWKKFSTHILFHKMFLKFFFFRFYIFTGGNPVLKYDQI